GLKIHGRTLLAYHLAGKLPIVHATGLRPYAECIVFTDINESFLHKVRTNPMAQIYSAQVVAVITFGLIAEGKYFDIWLTQSVLIGVGDQKDAVRRYCASQFPVQLNAFVGGELRVERACSQQVRCSGRSGALADNPG